MKTAIFTICSRNYLAYALTLQKSVAAAEPEAEFFIYLADEDLAEDVNLPVKVIPASQLALPDLLDMSFRYTIMEFNTAIKADCFLDLLTQRGFEAAIYLDPDIQVMAPMAEVVDALRSGDSAVLTPHILQPPEARVRPDEIEIMQSGIFNLGFAAFSRTEESLRFLNWWAGMMHRDCYAALDRGLFVDQKFVDFAPAFIERLHILRHPGYNVAYWNLGERHLVQREGKVDVNGSPLIFFHFSGVVPGDQKIFSKHLGDADQSVNSALASLLSGYHDALAENRHSHWKSIPYAWGRFRDGNPILPPMRRHPPEHKNPVDWFSAPDLEYWNAPDPKVEQSEGQIITRLMTGIYCLRPDLREAFPLTTSMGRLGFHTWIMTYGKKEYGLPDVYLPVRTSGFIPGPLRHFLTKVRYRFSSARSRK